MSSDSRFLLLPRELRDQIYQSYLTTGTEGGYVFDFQSGKLRTANNQPIDLGLMYTCRLVANEMRGLALRLNTITFSTLYSDDLRVTAARFGFLVERYYKIHLNMLSRIGPCMDQDKVDRVARRYPETVPVLRSFMKGDEWPLFLGVSKSSCGEVKSVFREGVIYALNLASAHPESSKFLLTARKRQNHDYLRMLLSGPEPWLIPTECDLDRMFQDIGYENAADEKSTRDHWESNCGKYRFSAAATAIHFLRSIPNSRCHIRRIRLCEDYEAVAYPECHAKGLIPFCRENPELRIERRVGLWRNIFQKSRWWDGCDWERRVDFPWDREGRLAADEVTRPVAEWMVEASVLGRAGMPQDPGTFTLVLDGDPTPERSSEVFCLAVQRDAAWQDAVEQCLVRDPLNWSEVLNMKLSNSFHSVGFPQLLRHLTSDKSSSGIHCNFDPGEPWDIAPIVEANRGWNREDWNERSWRPDLVFETAPPLPKWADLVRENIFPRIWEMEGWEFEEWELEELNRED